MDTDDGVLLGLRLWNGWRSSALPLRSGLTVLYGQNGAGKTSWLTAMQGALSGIRGRFSTELFVRLAYRNSALPWSEAFKGYATSREEASRNNLNSMHFPFDAYRAISLDEYGFRAETEWQELDVVEAATNWWEWHGFDADPALAKAALQSRSLCLVPIGVEQPSWEVWLAAYPTDPQMKPYVDEISDVAHEAEGLLMEAHRVARDGEEEDRLTDPYFEEISERLFPRIDQNPLLGGLAARLANRTGSIDRLRMTQSILFRNASEFGSPWWPQDGMPIRIAKLAEAPMLRWPQLLVEAGDSRLDAILRYRIRNLLWPSEDDLWKEPEARMGDVVEGLQPLADTIAAQANRLLQQSIPSAPTIEVLSPPPSEWPFTGGLRWGFDGKSGFEALSAGQQRWARIAALLSVGLADPKPGDGGEKLHTFTYDYGAPSLLILDEPEAHLHRSAEHHMAQGLRDRITPEVGYVIAATHSPELLDSPRSHLYWVDNLELTPLEGVELNRLEALGLRPSDLLGITRVLLIVEGRHDELVLSQLLGDRFRSSNTVVIPLHGGRSLKDVFDSQVLFRFTNAHVVGVLDNMSAQHIRDLWEEALVKAAEAGVDLAVQALRDGLPGKEKAENLYMRQWLIEAIKAPDAFPRSRMSPFGLERQDIIEYLPVQSCVRSAQSWEELRQKHSDLINSGQIKEKRLVQNFKDWIANAYGADFSDESILEAIRAMDSVPVEFCELADRCDQLRGV